MKYCSGYMLHHWVFRCSRLMSPLLSTITLAAVVGSLKVLQGCVQHPIDSDCDNVAFCC